MRLLLFMLFAFAIGKLATQSYIRQQSASETIIAAYREYAIRACLPQLAPAPQPLAGAATPLRPAQVEGDHHGFEVALRIGDDDVDVRLWQTSHPLWSVRYRDPALMVRATASSATICRYDIKRGVVELRSQDRPPARSVGLDRPLG